MTQVYTDFYIIYYQTDTSSCYQYYLRKSALSASSAFFL